MMLYGPFVSSVVGKKKRKNKKKQTPKRSKSDGQMIKRAAAPPELSPISPSSVRDIAMVEGSSQHPPSLKDFSDQSSSSYSDETLISFESVSLKEINTTKLYEASDDDEAEDEDDFPELPVRFRSLKELACNNEEDQDEESIAYSFSKDELRERDLLQAKELERHARELESMHLMVESLQEKHRAEIKSMEQTFNDERTQREDLLEQALGYAEELEAAERKNEKVHASQVKSLLHKLKKRDATIKKLEAENTKQHQEIRRLQASLAYRQYSETRQNETQIEKLQQSLADYESRMESLSKRSMKRSIDIDL